MLALRADMLYLIGFSVATGHILDHHQGMSLAYSTAPAGQLHCLLMDVIYAADVAALLDTRRMPCSGASCALRELTHMPCASNTLFVGTDSARMPSNKSRSNLGASCCF